MNAIVAVGFLPDDGPRYVSEVVYRQDASKRAFGPATEITIEAIS